MTDTHHPEIDPTAFVHDEAIVIGRVHLGARASVWPTAVLRADSEVVRVGAESNVQDGAVLHADPGFPAIVGDRVAIGHRAIVHGATVEDDCLIGMGAIVLNGARVGRGSLIGAGAVCKEGMEIPPDSVVLGVPARVVRETTPEMRERIAKTVRAYLQLSEAHRGGQFARGRGRGRGTERE
ncbi:MAG TPA: gamma carbonic anhydrase family protein [Gemmatimonadaceae bacterium]|jgi:carbonic anhydrase/acetyltransferase-like protein (isoleucine patch superfamily)|nr:gamma carbonic anhydrase family protein [Gemmatimonadaceae bacterium]